MRGARMLTVTSSLLLAGALVPDGAAAQFGDRQKFVGAHVGLSSVGTAPAIGVNGEVAYNERIGIGAWVDTWSYGDSYATSAGSYDWNVRYISLAGTGSYHFPIESMPKLDPFLGLALGYYVVSSEAQGVTGASYGGSASRIFLGGFGGARYAFRENMRGVARLGIGASYLTVGLDFKL